MRKLLLALVILGCTLALSPQAKAQGNNFGIPGATGTTLPAACRAPSMFILYPAGANNGLVYSCQGGVYVQLAVVSLSGSGGAVDGPATLPTSYVAGSASAPLTEPTFPNTSGYVVKTVCASTCDYTTVQAAVTAIHADGGDTSGEIIKLASGVTFTEHVTLPVYTMTAGKWVIITTDTAAINLPAAGVRIDPTYLPITAIIKSPGTNLPSIQAVTGGSNHYWIMGITVQAPATNFTDALIRFGNSEALQANIAHDNVVDRVYFLADPTAVTRRSLNMDCINCAAINNYMSNFKDTSDANNINLFNTPGPGLIMNNYGTATGENILFGGTDPVIANLVPSDWVIAQNHWDKLVAWNPADPTYDGSFWTVENHIEIKNGQRILMEGNVLSHVWPGGQSGWSLMIFPANVTGAATWATAANITIRYNSFVDLGGVMEFNGACKTSVGGCLGASQPSSNISFHDNLAQVVGGSLYDPGNNNGQFIEAVNDSTPSVSNVTINHNTVFQTRNIVFATDPSFTTSGFVFENNIQPHNLYGVIGTSSCCASTTLNTYFPSSVFTYNVLENIAPSGLTCANYAPGTNFCPASWTTVDFVDNTNCQGGTLAISNCALQAASPYHNAGTDGADLGANIATVISKTAGVN